MSLALLGLGTAVPLYSIEQRDAARLANVLYPGDSDRERLVATLYERMRIQKRGSVLLGPGKNEGPEQFFFPPARGEFDRGPTTEERMECYIEEAGALALASARRALEESGIATSRLTHLVTVSCTGFKAPGLDVMLIRELGLDPAVARTHIGFMGCHGAINGLRVAQAFADAVPSSRVLLVAVELCSLHFSYGGEREKIVVNGLFADGAGAVVVGRESTRAGDAWELKATGSTLFPDSEEAMSWRVGNHGFEMTLSPRVPDLIASHLGPWLERWLVQRGLALHQIRSWAVHPGGPKVLDAVSEALGLSREATFVSREILREFGNMSSATTLFILERLRRQKASGPCLALAFGPGLAAEVALLG